MDFQGSAPHGSFTATVTDVDQKVQALSGAKAAGPDGLPPGVVKAGGCPMAVMIHDVIQTTINTFTWPARWKGGWMVTPWKGKGSTTECNDHRGILVADAMSKVPTGLLKDAVQPSADNFLPEN